MDDEDHYKVLGLNRNASREEIKEAFRKLAIQFHPDKHSHSSNAVRDNATLKFKQLSQAYEILSDQRKRADYDNICSHSVNKHRGYGGYGYGYGYGQSHKNYSYKSVHSSSMLDVALGFFTTRAFLLNLAVASALVGGIYVIDMGWEELWKIHNSGKSFEAAMESIEKAKTQAHEDER